MKTAKEYPATHSMSTAWFAADVDGNVAIFDFNENGPIPNCAPIDDSIESILCDKFSEVKEDMPCPVLCLSDEQALEFYNNCHHKIELSTIEYIGESVIKIDISREKDFFDITSKCSDCDYVCLSRKLGLYYVSYLDGFAKSLLDILQEVFLLPFFISDQIDTQNDTVKFDYKFEKLPFYIFAQPYWTDYPIKRLCEPNFPFRLSQLPGKVQERMLRLPIKFSEHPCLQIADYVPVHLDFKEFEEQIETEVFPTEKLTLLYNGFSDGNGVCSYYLTDILPNYFGYLLSYRPTVFAFSDSPIDTKIFAVINYSCYVANMIDYQNIKCDVEILIRTFNPHLFLISDLVTVVVEKFFPISNHIIEICGQTFPYYLYSEIEAHHDEIMEYANREYRGVKIPIKLTEDEIKIKLRESETSIH